MTSRSKPPDVIVSEALQLRIAEQQALQEWSWLVAVLGSSGNAEERKELAIRESTYRQLANDYMKFVDKHGICFMCNGDGEWENQPGLIGPCFVCKGSGRRTN